MALPAGLANAQTLMFDGLGFGRSGSFTVAGQPVRFERSADRLSLFQTVVADRAALDFSLAEGTPAELRARCAGRALELQRGSVAVNTRPFALACEMTGAVAGRLELGPARSAQAGALQPAPREGRYSAGQVTLALAAVHALQGTPLPLATPAGYVFSHDGQPVAALELTGTRPVLRRLPVQAGPASAQQATPQPALQPAVADAVLHAAVALALLWNPQDTAAH
jgi:hypothetical protein